MKKNTPLEDLKATILLLENQQKEEIQLLKKELSNVHENLKPINFLRNTLHEILHAPDVKDDLLNALFALVAGYFSKKISVGDTENPLKAFLGSLLQFGVTGVVAEHIERIKSFAKYAYSLIFKK